jgi:hypothetical protein
MENVAIKQSRRHRFHGNVFFFAPKKLEQRRQKNGQSVASFPTHFCAAQQEKFFLFKKINI